MIRPAAPRDILDGMAAPLPDRVAWFLRARGADATADAPADLDEALAGAIDRARAAWPQLSIPDEAFVAHVAARLPDRTDPAHFARTLNAPDLLLALGCARADPAALAAFERRYFDDLGALVVSVTRDPHVIDELRQVLREKLLVGGAAAPPRIASYSGRGALLAWVRIAASRAALDLVQARAAQPWDELDAAADRIGGGGDFEAGYLRERFRAEFARALRDAFAALSPEQRNHLRLAFIDGLSVDELGSLFGVHRATAARRVQAARTAVFDETRRLLQERLALAPADFDSVCRAVYSQLDLSLSRILPSTDGA